MFNEKKSRGTKLNKGGNYFITINIIIITIIIIIIIVMIYFFEEVEVLATIEAHVDLLYPPSLEMKRISSAELIVSSEAVFRDVIQRFLESVAGHPERSMTKVFIFEEQNPFDQKQISVQQHSCVASGRSGQSGLRLHFYSPFSLSHSTNDQ